MTQMFVAVEADRAEVDTPVMVAGSLQQTLRFMRGKQCVCSVLVMFEPGSKEWLEARQCVADPVIESVDG